MEMNKVSGLVNYWIFVIAVLIFSKLGGLNLNKTGTLKIVILATVLYICTVLVWRIFKRKGQIARGEDPDGGNSGRRKGRQR